MKKRKDWNFVGLVMVGLLSIEPSFAAQEKNLFFKHMALDAYEPRLYMHLPITAVDPTVASTIGGFRTQDATQANYEPGLRFYASTDCSGSFLGGLSFGAILFNSSQVNPVTWYLTSTGLASYVNDVGIADPTSVLSVGFVDQTPVTVTCAQVVYALGAYTRVLPAPPTTAPVATLVIEP